MEKSPARLSLAAYTRISREGYRSQAEIDKQHEKYEDTCRREAARLGGDIARVVAETDVSGTTAADDRALGALLTATDIDGIIVPNVERFARDVAHGLTAYREALAAGKRLIFVEDGIDSADGDADVAEERFTYALLRGQGFVKRTSKRFAADAADSVKAGVHAGSIPPLGYRWPGTEVELPNGKRRFKKSGPLEVTEDAPRVVAGFTCYAEGGSWSQVVKAFGVRSQGAARAALRNRAYLGEARGAGVVAAEAHEPIIEPSLWARVERRMAEGEARHLSTEKRPKRGTRKLGGILRCAECGTALRYETATASYRCRSLVEHEGGRPSVRAKDAEAYIVAEARDWHAASYASVALATAVDEATMPVLRDALAKAVAEKDALVARREDFAPLVYAEALSLADTTLDAARIALDNAEAAHGWHALSPERAEAKLTDDGSVNAWLRELVTVTVTPSGRHVALPIAERLTVTRLAAGKPTAERTAGLPLVARAKWPAEADVEAYRS